MAEETQENQDTEEVRVEVHFYSTPYLVLLRHKDIKGIILKAHINWLGQELSHCAIRIVAGGIDRIAQSTWTQLKLYETSSIQYEPAIVIDVTHMVDAVDVIGYITQEFQQPKDETMVKVSTLLLLTRHRAHEVTQTTCTGFVAKCLGFKIDKQLLYPDNLCLFLQKWVSIE